MYVDRRLYASLYSCREDLHLVIILLVANYPFIQSKRLDSFDLRIYAHPINHVVLARVLH